MWRLFLIGVLGPLLGAAQSAPVRDFDPDTIRTLYFSKSGRHLLPLAGDVMVQTRLLPGGGYEDRLTDVDSQKVRLLVRHEPATGHAVLTMNFATGRPRLRATYQEDTTATPVVYLVPSLRRPLAATAPLDGEVTTYYPDGRVRQQARYRLGRRLTSQCIDFFNRLVPCNDNPLLLPAQLPLALQAGKRNFFRPPNTRRPLAAYVELAAPGDLRALHVPLRRRALDTASVAAVLRQEHIPVHFVLAAGESRTWGSNIVSNEGTPYLRHLALWAGTLFFGAGGMQPARLDGELITTYFSLPVVFELQ